MQRIKKTYRLLSGTNLTMHMLVDGCAPKDIEFGQMTVYDITGQYSTTDEKVQKWLESQYGYGRLYNLESEVDTSEQVRAADEEIPVFQNEATDVMEFPNFNAAKKYAIDTYGVEAKEVRNIGLLEPFLKEKGIAFKIG